MQQWIDDESSSQSIEDQLWTLFVNGRMSVSLLQDVLQQMRQTSFVKMIQRSNRARELTKGATNPPRRCV